ASGGTIFLDEIGDMPFSLQAKILRLLEEKSIERIGGRETIPVDVRIIAATNRNLESAIQNGSFREDLYYRLKVVTLWLPSLRERKGDINLLAQYFIARYTAELEMENPGITVEAKDTLNNYPWPGNVRELANTIHKAIIFNRGAPISQEDIRQAIVEKVVGNNVSEVNDNEALRRIIRRELSAETGGENIFDHYMDKIAGIIIGETLQITDGNRSRAAKLLGLSRPTLHTKIEKYQLKFETLVK
ncbi:MAG: sigma 54-interacting transcriptional regulator, partial [Proteobacteria bacterium]|nr:sigma 54-interacting transcriptional regulator [Pseudomonadota bacterium]